MKIKTDQTTKKIINMKKAKPDIKLIIFDVDGTLIDTALYIVMNYTHLFLKYHKPVPSLETMVYFSGPPLVDIFKEYFPEIDQKELLDEFQSFASTYDNVLSRLYPDEINVLNELKEAGYLLAIQTSKRAQSLSHNLDHFDMSDLFSSIICLDSGLKPKPDPAGIKYILNKLDVKEEEAFIIGDSETDIEAGKRANIHTGLVIYGLKKIPDIQSDEEYASFKDIERSFLL